MDVRPRRPRAARPRDDRVRAEHDPRARGGPPGARPRRRGRRGAPPHAVRDGERRGVGVRAQRPRAVRPRTRRARRRRVPRVGRRALPASSSRRAARRRPPPRRGTRPLVRGDPPRRPVLVGRERRGRARPRRRGTDASLERRRRAHPRRRRILRRIVLILRRRLLAPRRRARRRVDAAARSRVGGRERARGRRPVRPRARGVPGRPRRRSRVGRRAARAAVRRRRARGLARRSRPELIGGGRGGSPRVRLLALGGNFGVAARADGANGHGLVAWGANGNGELGLGEKRTHRARRGSGPRPVESFESGSSGRSERGRGLRGRVAGRAPRRRVAPRDGGDGGRAAVRVGVGRERRAARGRGVQLGGQLGLGNGEGDFWAPARVPGFGPPASARASGETVGRVVDVSCGFNHSVVIVDTGEGEGGGS